MGLKESCSHLSRKLNNLDGQEIEVSNLQPLACPLPEQKLWNMHPRVYLTFSAAGQAKCPYCGTKYVRTTVE